MKTHLIRLCCWTSIALLLGACTEAGRCRQGEAGCTPRENERCNSGTTYDEERNRCVDDDSDPEAGNGGDSGSGGTGGSDPEPVECPDDSVEEACQAFCEAYCQNQERLCVESRCNPGDCDPGGDFEVDCVMACEEDQDCAHDLCVGQMDVECQDFGYTDTLPLDDGSEVATFVSLCDADDPVCVPGSDIGCSNLCGTTGDGVGGELVRNNRCEDGGEGSVSPESPLCNRGTDCFDCGVRLCVMTGESCGGHGDCCGFYENGAFCVELSSGPTCLATCTESGVCPDDLRCLLVDDEENRVCAP
jgi:hypothetical protein